MERMDISTGWHSLQFDALQTGIFYELLLIHKLASSMNCC